MTSALRVEPSDCVAGAISAFAAAQPVIVVTTRPQGDAVIALAARTATEQAVAFAVRHGSGFLCVPLEVGACARLDLPLMWGSDCSRPNCSFAVTVDAVEGATTGISARDRALTVRRLADPAAEASEFSRPGHVVPIRVRREGTARRRNPGLAEAALELALLAGLGPAAAFCALTSPVDATRLARGIERVAFARAHGLTVVSVGQITRGLPAQSGPAGRHGFVA